VDEIVFLVRSQAAAIFGNLALVVPVAIVLEFAFESAFGRPLMPEAKAHQAIESFSVLGPSLLYAAFTGVLLWLSGLVAAAADNWFTYKRIAQSLEHSPALNRWCSEKRLREVVVFLRGNVAALTGSVSLGFMLGLLPEIFRFAGLPLDIRHVTLAAATLAAAVTGLGAELLSTPGFWLSLVGVLGVGVLNVVVSFSLAFFLAIRARDVRAAERWLLYRALLRRFAQRPLTFLLPIAPR
jgi:site-specific recombinase